MIQHGPPRQASNCRKPSHQQQNISLDCLITAHLLDCVVSSLLCCKHKFHLWWHFWTLQHSPHPGSFHFHPWPICCFCRSHGWSFWKNHHSIWAQDLIGVSLKSLLHTHFSNTTLKLVHNFPVLLTKEDIDHCSKWTLSMISPKDDINTVIIESRIRVQMQT